jgi:flagellar FliL protein
MAEEKKGKVAEEKKEREKDVEEEQEPQPKKSFLKFIILGVIVIAVGTGGYLGWDLLVKGKKEGPKTPKSRPQIRREEVGMIYPLESFIVNLMDKAGLGKRYLKVKIILEIGGEEAKKVVDGQKPRLRDTILLLLSSQSFKEINTMEGKLELKQALLSRINQALGEGIVQRIYFTEFVVQ